MAIARPPIGVGAPELAPPPQGQERHRGPWGYVVTGVAAAALAATVAVVATRGGDETEAVVQPPAAEAVSPTTQAAAAEAEPTETDLVTADINFTDIEPGQATISATLFSGETIKVPALPNLSEDPSKTINAFFGLYACTFSAMPEQGGLDCMRGITHGEPKIERGALLGYNDVFTEALGQTTKLPESYQVSIFGSSGSDTFTTTRSADDVIVTYDPSEDSDGVYLNAFVGSNGKAVPWQAEETRDMSAPYLFELDTMRIVFSTNTSNETYIKDADVQWTKAN